MSRDRLELAGILLALFGLALVAWAAWLLRPEAGYAVAGAGLLVAGVAAVRAANTAAGDAP